MKDPRSNAVCNIVINKDIFEIIRNDKIVKVDHIFEHEDIFEDLEEDLIVKVDSSFGYE